MAESLTTPEKESAGFRQADDHSLDAQLLARIALKRDAGALSRFFEHHQRQAYGLALQLTGSHQEAQDVLQESLLVVWQRAGQYRGSGLARSWFLRIVALKALHLRRGQRRADRFVQEVARKRSAPGAEGGWAEDRSLCQEEIVGTLQAALATLSDLDRVVLTLHYAADLRVAEIARQCRLPRQTVQARMERALGVLRSRLRAAGVTALPALLPAGLLQEALFAPVQVPVQVSEFLSEGVSQVLLSGTQRSVQVARWGWTAGVFSTAAILCVVAGVWTFQGEVQPPAGTGAPRLAWAPSVPEPAVRPGPDPALAAPFAHHFSFATPQHIRFPVTQGEWNWQPAAFGGSGGLVVGSGRPLFCFLPARVPRQPLLLELRLRLQENRRAESSDTHFACGAFRAGRSSTPPYRQYKMQGKWRGPLKDEYRHRAYLLERFTVGLFESDWLHYIHEFEESYPGDRILIELENWVVAEIRVRALREDELPAWAGEPLSLLRGLEVSRTQFPPTPCGLFLRDTGEAVPCTPPFPGEPGQP